MPEDSSTTREADDWVRLSGLLHRLERATLRAESPLRRAVGSNRLNPLPHAGTISVFLLIVVTLTGIYLTLFFEFGFEGSFRSVVKMQNHPIQRTIRGLHRYSSAGLVATVAVHAFRTFVMARFTGPRRFRWFTGMLALVLVWLAGVTGYWLIWDVRAQALWEATANLIGSVSEGWEFEMLTVATSGWLVLLLMWFAHFLLTAAIGWATWRHLRNSRFRWLPPKRWRWLMGLALVFISILLPPGMLTAADSAIAPTGMPLDPFVMFLLPPLLSGWPWSTIFVAILLTGFVTAIPWWLRRSDPPVAEIVEPKCTGCELCVIDCPYLALSMTGGPDDAIAVVDPDRCVGCGICVGSCSFGAITGLGSPDLSAFDVGAIDGPVVVACDRHLRMSGLPTEPSVIAVTCTGMLNPQALSALVRRGADDLRVIGCNPGDCTFGVGNLLTSERLVGDRNPHLARSNQGSVTQDWISPTELANVIAAPGTHPAADIDSAPSGRWVMVPAVVVVLISVIAIRFITDLPFSPGEVVPVVRVAIDHQSGAVIAGQESGTGGTPSRVDVFADGILVASEDVNLTDGSVKAIIDIEVPETDGPLDVRLIEGDDSSLLYSGTLKLEPADRLLVQAIDVGPSPGAMAGQDLFESEGLGGNLGCQICHSVRPGEDGVGPSLASVGLSAAERVVGLGAEEYLRMSILDPDAYVVDGYPAGQMLDVYSERLTDDELDALVAYLLSLVED